MATASPLCVFDARVAAQAPPPSPPYSTHNTAEQATVFFVAAAAANTLRAFVIHTPTSQVRDLMGKKLHSWSQSLDWRGSFGDPKGFAAFLRLDALAAPDAAAAAAAGAAGAAGTGVAALTAAFKERELELRQLKAVLHGITSVCKRCRSAPAEGVAAVQPPAPVQASPTNRHPQPVVEDERVPVAQLLHPFRDCGLVEALAPACALLSAIARLWAGG